MSAKIYSSRSNGLSACDGGKIVRSGIPKKIPKKLAAQDQATAKRPDKSKSLVAAQVNEQQWHFPTNYCRLIKHLPYSLPSILLKGIHNNDQLKKKENLATGRVRIMLRVCSDRTLPKPRKQEFLRVEENMKHISVFVPSDPERRNNVLAPKVYAFDSVFTDATSQEEICQTSLTDVIQAVLHGADGTVFCYGQSNLGKTYVLFGSDRLYGDVGMVPCAINWLYKCIGEMKKKQRTRLFVRISAIEVYGRSEKLKDLLVGLCDERPSSPLCIKEDPLLGTQIQNQCEISAHSPQRAAFLLDAALATRSCSRMKNSEESRKHSHLIFTLHVYHHRLEKTGEGVVSGGRSRLHFIDLGSCDKNIVKTTSSLALSQSSLGHVIMSIVNNDKHIPFKESKLTQLLRELLGNINCRAVMIAHVSRDVEHYSDALSIIQLASRIHRVLKKRGKLYCEGHYKAVEQRYQKPKQLRSKFRDDESIGSSSGLEFTSGSELSCDTVVYVNNKGVLLSDRDLTDNEGPPDAVPIPMPLKFLPSSAMLSQDEKHVCDTSHPKSLREFVLKPYQNNGKTNHNQKGYFGFSTDLFNMNESSQFSPEHFQAIRKKRNGKIPSELELSICRQELKNQNQTLKNSNDIKIENNCSLSSIPRLFTANKALINSSKCIEEPQKLTSSKIPRNNASLELKSSIPVKPPRQRKPDDRNNFPKTKILNISCEENFSFNDQSVHAHNSKIESKLKYFNNENMAIKFYSATNEDTYKKLSDCVSEDNSKMQLSLQQQITDISENLLHCKRPEPVGCDSENKCKVLRNSNEIKKLEYNRTFNLSQNFQTCSRPDSMLVNVDDGDWCICNEQTNGDRDADVNFYCLTFATRNPLIPLSKRKYSQQILNNIKRQNSLATNAHQEVEHVRNMRYEKIHDLDSSDKSLEEYFSLQETPKHFNENQLQEPYNNLDIISPQQIAFSKNVRVLQAQNESQPDDIESNTFCANTIDTSSLIENLPHEICIYDSNSLEISYASAKQINLSNAPIVSQLNSNQIMSTASSQKKIQRDTTTMETSSRPVIIKKSESKEGARLTLVKKSKSGESTLELLVLNENDESNSSRISQNNDSRVDEMIKDAPNRPSIANSKKILNCLSQLSPKRSKWSRLSRLKNKKKDQADDVAKSKISFVSKLTKSKHKTSTNVNNLKFNRKNQKFMSQLPVLSLEATEVNSKKFNSIPVSKSRSNFRVFQRLTQKQKIYSKEESTESILKSGHFANWSAFSPSRFGFLKKEEFKKVVN